MTHRTKEIWASSQELTVTRRVAPVTQLKWCLSLQPKWRQLAKQNVQMKYLYDVLELGAGAGKMTELLVKELPQSVRYLATEPSQEFLDTLKAKGLKIETAQAKAESIPVPDDSVLNVVCAQSFYWFSELEGLKEIRRVLTPGGCLIINANMKEFDEGWTQLFADQWIELMRRFGSSSRHWVSTMDWKTDIDVSPLFSLKEHRTLPVIEFYGDLDAIMAFISTTSGYKLASQEEANEMLEQLRAGIRNWPGIDPANIKMLFFTDYHVYTATGETQ